MKKKIMSEIQELQQTINDCSNPDTLQSALKHVQAATNVIKALQNTSNNKNNTTILVKKMNIAPNQNHKKQPKFFSTKKRRSSGSSSLSQPTLKQRRLCLNEIYMTEPIFCASCLKENDLNYNNQLVEWIQCNMCNVWMHLSCTIPKLTSVPTTYICSFCEVGSH